MADGFVIVSSGRYLGMGASSDVMRSLQSSRVLAARYTNPLTLLPGQVPINEHLDRLLAGRVPFTAWFIEVDQMRGLNDSEGFVTGDALIHSTARLVESACAHGIDFAGHVTGSRFVLLVQSGDWRERAEKLVARFPEVIEAHVPVNARERGYFTVKRRDGRDYVRPLPKLVVGILPVLPGVFESRHEVVAVRLYDRLEMELPDLGVVVMQDAETGDQVLVDTHDRRFRKRFAEAAARREEDVRASFRKAGVDALELATDDNLTDAILRFADLRKRRSQLAAGGSLPPHLEQA